MQVSLHNAVDALLMGSLVYSDFFHHARNNLFTEFRLLLLIQLYLKNITKNTQNTRNDIILLSEIVEKPLWVSRFLPKYMAGQTSKENGKKGGRPKGYVALEAEKARQLITERINEHLESIISALIKKAKSGDIRAIRELFDRSWGKPVQAVNASVSSESPIPLFDLESVFDNDQRYEIAKRTVDRHESKKNQMITGINYIKPSTSSKENSYT